MLRPLGASFRVGKCVMQSRCRRAGQVRLFCFAARHGTMWILFLLFSSWSHGLMSSQGVVSQFVGCFGCFFVACDRASEHCCIAETDSFVSSALAWRYRRYKLAAVSLTV